MVTLDSIFENVIAEILILAAAFLISKFAPNLINKGDAIKKERKFDILNIAFFLTSLSIFNLILSISFWNRPDLNMFLIFSSFVLVYVTIYIHNNQCPSCKKVLRAKKVVDKKIINEFKRPFKYRLEKIWLYSNGEMWKRKYVGKEKTRIENWITKQEFYECRHCLHKWDSGHFDVNLDEETRPQPEYIQTDKKDPTTNSFS